AVVCTVVGNTDERKMRKIGDMLPTPNHRIAIGIHAIGEMGRSICTTGLMAVNAPATRPIQSPSGIPTATASEKPTVTRNSDAPMWRHSDPFPAISRIPVTTASGVGKIRLPAATTASHHTPISTIDTANDATICFGLSNTVIRRTDAKRLRQRLD